LLDFITLQTDEGRKVSLSFSDRMPELCFLLGHLAHNTQFKRSDMVEFAHEVLEKFEGHDEG